MRFRIIAIVLTLFALCIGVLKLATTPPHASETQGTNERAISSNIDPAPATQRPTIERSNKLPKTEKTEPINSKENSDDYFDLELMKSNSVYIARVKKHLRLRNYYNSPAKDTVECEKIRQILEREGIGLDAVGDVYNAVWNYNQAKQMREKAAPNDSKNELLFRMLRDNTASDLMLKYGLNDSSAVDALFAIQPKVFFGRYDGSIQSGERLLDH